jgi:hypothetical protein
MAGGVLCGGVAGVGVCQVIEVYLSVILTSIIRSG